MRYPDSWLILPSIWGDNMTQKFKWYGDEVIETTRQSAIKALKEGAGHLETEANKTVPYQDGVLEGSSQVNIDEELIEASVSYNTPYAVRWHEAEPGTVDFDGKGRARWLRRTANEQAERILDHMAKVMKGGLK